MLRYPALPREFHSRWPPVDVSALAPAGMRNGTPAAITESPTVRELEGDPDLFAVAPLDLFRPLGDPYARIYWRLLARTYAYKFEGSPLELPRAHVIDSAEEIISSTPEWREKRAELLASLQEFADPEAGPVRPAADDLRAIARRVVARLAASGWFYFEYQRGVGEVLNFPPYAARLLGQMMSVARDEQPIFPGYAHAVDSMLGKDRFARAPGPALAQVKRLTLEFARELRILHGNIRESIQRLFSDHLAPAGVLREALERYEDRVRRNYHLLKTRDNIFAWRVEVLGRLDAIEGQREQLAEAARWGAAQNGLDETAALARVEDDLGIVRSHIEAMPRIMREIDDRNQRFTGVATRRISYLLRHDRRTEGQLQFLIDQLGAERIPPLEVEVYQARFLGPDCLYVPRRAHIPVENAPVQPLGATDAAAARAALQDRLLSPFRQEMVNRFVRDLLAGRRRMPIREVPVTSDEEYVRLTYVVGYGDARRALYRFERTRCGDPACTDPECGICRVRSGSYSYPNGTIEWRGR